MKDQGSYDLLSTKCINIIKNNSPQDSVNMIANLKLPCDKNKIGINKALEIYKLYADESVEYDSVKYRNNINEYKKKVNNNINNSKKYSKK